MKDTFWPKSSLALCLSNFTDPKHPHQEVTEAVVVALKQFDSDDARVKCLPGLSDGD